MNIDPSYFYRTRAGVPDEHMDALRKLGYNEDEIRWMSEHGSEEVIKSKLSPKEAVIRSDGSVSR
jgi:Holliday junction resolvasome RuvABC DNA-binding subunit